MGILKSAAIVASYKVGKGIAPIMTKAQQARIIGQIQSEIEASKVDLAKLASEPFP